MNIPAEVKTRAHDALRVDCNEDDEYAVIAEWAGKEALREASYDPRLRLSGHSGISIKRLRALAEGDAL